MRRIARLSLVMVCAAASCAAPHPPAEAPPHSTPPDRPFAATSDEEAARLQRVIAPFISQARATYPAAKNRFLQGLPPGHVFSVTVVLRDPQGHQEQVFLQVESIKDGLVAGRTASDIHLVSGFGIGDRHQVAEGEILDWTISRPDGTEEGNLIGRFIDHYVPGARYAVVFGYTVAPDGSATNIRIDLMAGPHGPVIFDPPALFIEAAKREIAADRYPQNAGAEPGRPNDLFTPFIYDPENPSRLTRPSR